MAKRGCPIGVRYGKSKVTQYGGVYTTVQKIAQGVRSGCFSKQNATKKATFLVNTMCGRGHWSRAKCKAQCRAAKRLGFRKKAC